MPWGIKNLRVVLDSNMEINQWKTSSIEVSLPNCALRKT
jgi:hypothetical protein